MEDKIFDIVTDLLRDDITKDEAVDKLVALHLTQPAQMEIEEAIQIIKDHNEWRRDRDVPSEKVMADPTELGIAIDLVISGLGDVMIWIENREKNKLKTEQDGKM
jgi:hypothetical protein